MKSLSRWQGALVGSLVLTLLGVLIGADGLLVVALVALLVVGLARVSSTPSDAYRIERSLSNSRPNPGEPVTVTLRIENESRRMLPDLRITEDLPESLTVISGSSSVGTALPPGGETTHSYELIAPRGEFVFGDLTVRRRNLASTLGSADFVTAEGTTQFTCETLIDSLPLRQQTIQFIGETPTNQGGPGVEFFSTREYRPGDPLNRIDWNQYARSGTLSTVEYRLERAVTVVFIIDDRAAGHVDAIGGGPNSFDLTLYAAARGIVTSLDDGNETGVATLSGEWVAPGVGDRTRSRLSDVLDAAEPVDESLIDEPGGGSDDDTTEDATEDAAKADRAVATDGGMELLHRLPKNGQVVICSPLVDDAIVEYAEQCSSHGHAVSVLSPDMTTGRGIKELSMGNRVGRLCRRQRISYLRGRNTAVADWNLREPLLAELQRLQRRWTT